MAYLGLAYSVNAAKALLYAVGVPWQIIIHHQMRTLQVDTFASGIGGNHDPDIFILFK